MIADNIIFTDISFDPKSKMAVMGYINNDVLFTNILLQTRNTEAEIKCIIWMIKSLTFKSHLLYTVYTDCKRAVDLQYKPSLKKPVYAELIALLQLNSNIRLVHIYGHKASDEKTDIDHKFSVLDNSVRQLMRKERDSMLM